MHKYTVKELSLGSYSGPGAVAGEWCTVGLAGQAAGAEHGRVHGPDRK